MPVQCGANNLIQRGMPRFPSQEFVSSGSEGDKFGGIARPAPRFPQRHAATAYSLHRRDNFANRVPAPGAQVQRSEEHTSELQSLAYLVCRLLLEKKNTELRVNSV